VGATANHVASMGVLFEQYGRIKDMKGHNRTKAPPIEEIEAYVKKLVISNFQYVPGYKYGQFPLASKTAINRIAWGLSRAMVRDRGHLRPKSWFSKTFYSSINSFIDAVTSRYLVATGTHMAASIKI
jgi:hypothetical protein